MSAPSEPTPVPAFGPAFEAAVAAFLADPVQRERLIVALERIGGQGIWARRVKGAMLVLAGALIILRGGAILDGASLAVGGAFAVAGAAELSGAL